MIMYEKQDPACNYTEEEIKGLNDTAQTNFLNALNSSQPAPGSMPMSKRSGVHPLTGVGDSFGEQEQNMSDE